MFYHYHYALITSDHRLVMSSVKLFNVILTKSTLDFFSSFFTVTSQKSSLQMTTRLYIFYSNIRVVIFVDDNISQYSLVIKA